MSRNVAPAVVAGVWPSDSVRDIAEQQGISNLSDDFVTALAHDVEYRLHEVVEEAAKFMRHARRTKLKTEDVEHALKARNLEPIWGFGAPNNLAFRRTQTAGGTLYFYDDEEIDLTRIYKTQLPPAPRDVSYTAHWLAVEGVQPAIPQNPSAAELQALQQPKASTSTSMAGGVDVRPLVKHVLSRELQLYFDRLTSAALDPDIVMRQAALKSLQADTGLAGLVPYLVQWIGERVVASLSNSLSDIENMLDFIRAMLDNSTLFVEPYLHQILPSILSVLLSRDLAPSSETQTQVFIRDYAAELLQRILTDFAKSYPSLQPRILKTLARGLAGDGDRYGAVAGLNALGREAVLSTLVRPSNIRLLDETLSSMEEEARLTLIALIGTVLKRHLPPATADAPPALSKEEASAHWGPIIAAEIAALGIDRAMLEAERDQEAVAAANGFTNGVSRQTSAAVEGEMDES